MSLHIQLWRFALHTGVQGPSTNALQLCLGHNAGPTVQCCCAMKAHSRQCVTAATPMDICSSHRCAGTQHQCTAALFRAKCSPYCSMLLGKTNSQQAVCHCKYTHADLLFAHVCCDTTPMRCIKVQGKLQSPLFSSALQNRLTAGSVSLQVHLGRSFLITCVQ